MLIPSQRHTAEDLAAWRRWEAMDRALYASGALLGYEQAAMMFIERFFSDGDGYLSVSWGKDSIVVADLYWRAATEGRVRWDVPLVWVRVDGVENPDCGLVRDRFLSSRSLYYVEIHASSGADSGKRTSALGFAAAARRFGDRYASGVRGAESRTRALAMQRGAMGDRTCRPIGDWTTEHVYAYLAGRDLPVHPAYACSWGGTQRRDLIRVGAIGGLRGRAYPGMRGRAEWERRYYPEIVRRIPRQLR